MPLFHSLSTGFPQGCSHRLAARPVHAPMSGQGERAPVRVSVTTHGSGTVRRRRKPSPSGMDHSSSESFGFPNSESSLDRASETRSLAGAAGPNKESSFCFGSGGRTRSPEERVELGAGAGLARGRGGVGAVGRVAEGEVLAEIAAVLVLDRIGAALTTGVVVADVVEPAVPATAEIATAGVALGVARDRIADVHRRAAELALAGHGTERLPSRDPESTAGCRARAPPLACAPIMEPDTGDPGRERYAAIMKALDRHRARLERKLDGIRGDLAESERGESTAASARRCSPTSTRSPRARRASSAGPGRA